MEHTVSSELPPIHGENIQQPVLPQAEVSGAEMVREQQGARRIESLAPQQPAQMPQAVTVQQQPQPQQPQQLPMQPPQSGLPVIADDTDLIEKEWVDRAKEIVARTKQDPYLQNKEVERMKADYMKKRYNKDVKITED